MAYKKAIRSVYVENTKDYADLSLRVEAMDVLVMPTKIEAQLKEDAAKKYPYPDDATDDEKRRVEQRRGAYIYGTMRRLGWKPNREKT